MNTAAVALFLSLMISTVGGGLMVYGKKTSRAPHLITGLVLVAYPYFVDSPWVMFGIASALLGAMAIAIRLGL